MSYFKKVRKDTPSATGRGTILVSRRTKIRKDLKMVGKPNKFIAACKAAGIPPTRRQQSKYLRGFGFARGKDKNGRKFRSEFSS